MKKTCTIIIFNHNSIGFLHLCLKQITLNHHPLVDVKIIIADQSTLPEEIDAVKELCGGKRDLSVVHMDALCSGYAVDHCIRHCDIQTDYICTMDCDAFAINKNYLYLPISLCEEFNINFVGGLFFESRPEEVAYYHNNNFYCMSQCYRVGRTEDYKKLSLNGGFTRFHERPKTGFTYLNDDWDKWAEPDYSNRGSDDGVVAHCWEDNHCEHMKLALATTHTIGDQKIETAYGGIIDGMVLHVVSSHWSDGIEDRVGKNYGYWKNRIKNSDAAVIEDMVAEAYKNPSNPDHPQGTQIRSMWNGIYKKSHSVYEPINNRLEELKYN